MAGPCVSSKTANGRFELLLELANLPNDFSDPRMFGVAHVKAKNIRPRLGQPSQRFLLFGRRTKRANDFGSAHVSQDSGGPGKSNAFLV